MYLFARRCSLVVRCTKNGPFKSLGRVRVSLAGNAKRPKPKSIYFVRAPAGPF